MNQAIHKQFEIDSIKSLFIFFLFIKEPNLILNRKEKRKKRAALRLVYGFGNKINMILKNKLIPY